MRSKAGLAESMEMVLRDLTVFQGAAREILDNPRLVELLVDVVRPFGNELNRANGKKDAPGIKISGLLKLGATKTADNTMTSLFYIVSVLSQHRPQLLEVCGQFADVKRASKLALKGLEDNFKVVRDTAALVKKGMDAARKAGDEVFIANMGPFETSFGSQVEDLDKSIAKCKKDLERAAEYLGEKGRDPSKPEDLCKEWTEFIALLSATWQEYRDKVAKAEKKKKEDAAKAEAAAKKAEAAAKKEAAAAAKREAAAAKEAAAAAAAAAAAQAEEAARAEREALAAAEAMEEAARRAEEEAAGGGGAEEAVAAGAEGYGGGYAGAEGGAEGYGGGYAGAEGGAEGYGGGYAGAEGGAEGYGGGYAGAEGGGEYTGAEGGGAAAYDGQQEAWQQDIAAAAAASADEAAAEAWQQEGAGEAGEGAAPPATAEE
jgi:chemotaxis protein histidine kinase CheA